MIRKSVLASATAAALVALAGDATAIEWKYSSWTPPMAPNNRFGTVPMFALIEKETKGTPNEITFRNFMGAQLFNNFTTLKGIRDGAVDAGVIVPVFTPAELKAHVTFAELQGATRDGWSTAGAGTETLLLNCPECLTDYDKNNTKTLGVYASAAYFLQCNFDVKSMDDLRGKKSAEGNPMFARWAASLGMSRVQMGPADMLQGLQRGTTDCIFGPKEWLFGYGLKDVVKTVVDDQPLGVFPAVGIMTINNNSWNKLSSPQKNIIAKHMPATIARVVNGYYQDEQRGEKEGKERGVKFVQWGAAYQKTWKDFQAKEPAAVLEAAKKRGVQSADAIVKANLDNLKVWQDMVDKSGGMNIDKYVAMLNQRVYNKIKF